MKYPTPSSFLEELDSHGIYGVGMLDECQFDTSMIPTYSMDETAAAIEQRGLGGRLEGDPNDRLFYGWTAATALAQAFLGRTPGNAFMGRGSSFRADLKALKEAGH